MPVLIRQGEKKDLPGVLNLVRELAAYEKALNQVTNTVEKMEQDGFGPRPVFGFFVALIKNQMVGTSIYYYRYSTWKGKRLYLEDIVVTEKFRGQGIGKRLFDATMNKALSESCSGMSWQVLDWNEPAINFYKKYYQAHLDGEWINCHLESEHMVQLLNSTDSR